MVQCVKTIGILGVGDLTSALINVPQTFEYGIGYGEKKSFSKTKKRKPVYRHPLYQYINCQMFDKHLTRLVIIVFLQSNHLFL